MAESSLEVKLGGLEISIQVTSNESGRGVKFTVKDPVIGSEMTQEAKAGDEGFIVVETPPGTDAPLPFPKIVLKKATYLQKDAEERLEIARKLGKEDADLAAIYVHGGARLIDKSPVKGRSVWFAILLPKDNSDPVLTRDRAKWAEAWDDTISRGFPSEAEALAYFFGANVWPAPEES